MIFAAALDERTLFVFATEEKAVAYCEGIDVEAGTWLFWSEDGSPLEPEFLTPNRRGRFWVASGVYRLVPARSGRPLADGLRDLCHMESNPFLPSLAAVHAHLADIARVPRDGA